MTSNTAGGPTLRSVRPLLLAGTILAPFGLAACGDDTGASAEYEEFCDANLAIDRAAMGEDEGAVEDAMTAILAASPNDDTREKVQATIDAFMALEGPPDAEFNDTYGELVSVVEDKCGFNDLSVEAADYRFSGIDDKVDAGATLVTFENKGTEYHEFMVMRRTDGDETPVGDLLAMDEAEAMSHVEPVAVAFAAPGEKSYTSYDFEAGKYVVVCFLPQGSTRAAWDEMMAGGAEPSGDPHAMLGMTFEFEVET